MEDHLRFHPWASERRLSAEDWTSADFALYTAGVLRGEGYRVTVVESTSPWKGSPTHVWLLVQIATADGNLWFPVEPSPPAGMMQLHLGTIPVAADRGPELWFESSYASFDRIIEELPNQQPVAALRPVATTPVPGERTRIMAAGTGDPDGEIVLYWWDFGDGATARTSTWHVHHEFPSIGTYRVAMTAVDNRGRSATATLAIRVASPDPDNEEDCGCGG